MQVAEFAERVELHVEEDLPFNHGEHDRLPEVG
jgi:hypothetical protein